MNMCQLPKGGENVTWGDAFLVSFPIIPCRHSARSQGNFMEHGRAPAYRLLLLAKMCRFYDSNLRVVAVLF